MYVRQNTISKHFFISNNINVYYVSDVNEFINTFLILKSVSYLEGQIKSCLASVSAKYYSNNLVRFGFIQFLSFLRKQAEVRKFHGLQFAEVQQRPQLTLIMCCVTSFA